MKSYLLAGVLSLALSGSVQADTWTGTITETVTSTNNPAYDVGEVYTGSYSYEAPSSDGTFYAFPWVHSPTMNTSLTGTYQAFISPQFTDDDVFSSGGGSYQELIVLNGVVVGFSFSIEHGFADVGATTGPDGIILAAGVPWNVPGNPPLSGEYGTEATMVFSDPVDASVPESDETAWLVGLTLLGYVAVRARTRGGTHPPIRPV